jgi:uncharacterized protein YdeI (YjbR/CyaY-like superfamily)
MLKRGVLIVDYLERCYTVGISQQVYIHTYIRSYINLSFQKKVFCETQNKVLTAWGESDKRGVFRMRKEQVRYKQDVLCHQYGFILTLIIMK